LADALDLDEKEAARVFFESQDDADILGRSVLESSIIRFHQTRKYLLDCFRLILQQSVDVNIDDNIKEVLQEVVKLVLQTPDNAGNGPKFVRKCFQSMMDIKSWLQNLTEKLNSASVLGQTERPEFVETIEYQRVSLVQQHESLGVILHYLVKSAFSAATDFEYLLEGLKKVDKNDNILGVFSPVFNITNEDLVNHNIMIQNQRSFYFWN
jgi:nuclear pore complex protein Nup205